MKTSPMERTGWFGRLSVENAPQIFARIERDFPVGTKLAISCTGALSPELRVETVTELKLHRGDDEPRGHIIIVTNDYVMGLSTSAPTERDAYSEDVSRGDITDIEFTDDRRGRRMTTKQYNGFGDLLTWIFLAVDSV